MVPLELIAGFFSTLSCIYSCFFPRGAFICFKKQREKTRSSLSDVWKWTAFVFQEGKFFRVTVWMKEKEVWLQCYPQHATHVHVCTRTPKHPSTQRFLMADIKGSRTQGPHYGPFIILDQNIAFQPLSKSVFLAGHFLCPEYLCLESWAGTGIQGQDCTCMWGQRWYPRAFRTGKNSGLEDVFIILLL